MFITPILILSLTAAALAVPIQGNEKRDVLEKRWTPPSEDLLKALHQATSPNERYSILPPDDFSFSFLDTPSFGGGGLDGGVVLGNDEIWPGVIGTGISMLMGFIGPCGMIAPHSHPRASEIYLNVAGPPLMAGIIPENGAPVILGTAGPGNATVLPQGSIHYIANTGCDPTVIVAGFNAENPGALFVSAAYAAFDTETYAAAFGGIGVQMLDPSKIPNTVILGRQDCFDSCGLDRSTFNISSVSKKELMLQAYAGFLRSEGFNSTSGV